MGADEVTEWIVKGLCKHMYGNKTTHNFVSQVRLFKNSQKANTFLYYIIIKLCGNVHMIHVYYGSTYHTVANIKCLYIYIY